MVSSSSKEAYICDWDISSSIFSSSETNALFFCSKFLTFLIKSTSPWVLWWAGDDLTSSGNALFLLTTVSNNSLFSKKFCEVSTSGVSFADSTSCKLFFSFPLILWTNFKLLISVLNVSQVIDVLLPSFSTINLIISWTRPLMSDVLLLSISKVWRLITVLLDSWFSIEKSNTDSSISLQFSRSILLLIETHFAGVFLFWMTQSASQLLILSLSSSKRSMVEIFGDFFWIFLCGESLFISYSLYLGWINSSFLPPKSAFLLSSFLFCFVSDLLTFLLYLLLLDGGFTTISSSPEDDKVIISLTVSSAQIEI